MGNRRDDALNPTPLTRLREALQPDWVHTAGARRAAAGLLVILAAVAAIRAEPGGEHDVTVVAVRDLEPGVALTVDDVRLDNRLTATLPDGAQSEVAPVVGALPADVVMHAKPVGKGYVRLVETGEHPAGTGRGRTGRPIGATACGRPRGAGSAASR